MSSRHPLRLSTAQWFLWTIGLLLFLAISYLLPHWQLSVGRSATTLTTGDMTTLSSLLYEPKPISTTTTSPTTQTATIPDSQRQLTDSQRLRAYSYIVNTYPMYPNDADTLQNWINLFNQPGALMSALKEHTFPVRSYFWLMGGWLYWEVIFWTWFGLIASLLFSVSEALRTNSKSFDQSEIWTHIAKFFYAPLCSIAIFLGLSLAITDQKVLDMVKFSPNQILVAFILGFFSGRVVDLLQRIKNVILPDGSLTPPVPPNTPVNSPSTTAMLALPQIETAIRQYGPLWQQAYPNVTGIAAQLKTTAGRPTGQAAIVFEVSQKPANLTVGAIPPSFTVPLANGQSIDIPTDVEEVGITRFGYREGQARRNNRLPTGLGSSVATRSTLAEPENWGTLGLRVHDSTGEYVLTCCHVLCGHLINDMPWFYDSSQHGPIDVVVPTNHDTQQIGIVVKASFNSKEDFALVRLTTPTDVDKTPLGMSIRFTDTEPQPKLHQLVNMVGAFSNVQSATISALYQEGQYEDIPDLVRPARMAGLIKTQLLSHKGDSGAAVFILDTNQKATVIGLLIANNEVASYILPVHNYLINNGLFLSV